MTGGQHAALRRALQKYVREQGEIECEQCATQSTSLSLVSPHKERAFCEIEAEGFNTDFDDDQSCAMFYEDTQAALIRKIFDLGDAACLCGSCGCFWMKLHREGVNHGN